MVRAIILHLLIGEEDVRLRDKEINLPGKKWDTLLRNEIQIYKDNKNKRMKFYVDSKRGSIE